MADAACYRRASVVCVRAKEGSGLSVGRVFLFSIHLQSSLVVDRGPTVPKLFEIVASVHLQSSLVVDRGPSVPKLFGTALSILLRVAPPLTVLRSSRARSCQCPPTYPSASRALWSWFPPTLQTKALWFDSTSSYDSVGLGYVCQSTSYLDSVIVSQYTRLQRSLVVGCRVIVQPELSGLCALHTTWPPDMLAHNALPPSIVSGAMFDWDASGLLGTQVSD
uniref:Uncharacterized protein n=1 Tax=Psilocybe cubensis TaxID=181762 RepID=A0A8H7XL63_PSICU